MSPTADQVATLEFEEGVPIVRCLGTWTTERISTLVSKLPSLPFPPDMAVQLDASKISVMDSAGAWLLQQCILTLQKQGRTVHLTGLTPAHESIYNRILHEIEKIKLPKLPTTPNMLYVIGEQLFVKCGHLAAFLAFVGEFFATFVHTLSKPKTIQWRSIMKVIETTGYSALPIIGLLMFLIGIVLTYQMGLQLQPYGANIFIVDITGMAVLREFGPLITAIIAAGRTSSSFTAQLGTMKVNEEIDALKTMGLSPINRLVLPKVIGIVIALPLLTVWADAFGVLGGMVMSKGMLGIGYYDFLSRFQETVSIRQLLIGLSKAPVFATIVAIVGCFQGFQVSLSAASVGERTTKSVVQAIFLIIIADAIFSIIFSIQGV